MKILYIFLLTGFFAFGQTNTYSISFENAVHHEAQVTFTIPNIKTKTITARMARTSPGRYALHEFAKNVYGFTALNSKGDTLDVRRPDPYSWEITGHDGTVIIKYTLFANRADGTYSQVDESHAHLNIPATFMFVKEFEERPLEVEFEVRKDLNWKVATQLKKITDTKYYAANLYYFMDSPTEISDYKLREFNYEGQNMRFVLHDTANDSLFDAYFENVKRIVKEEAQVYGGLPKYDYGEYTFLACYLPHVSGDGMEHRNSTILTDTEGLANGGMDGNIGTVSHEFFHCWNVERIRPDALEPFDFTEANMSGELWFAEGFTSYYTGLILLRAGIITQEKYLEGVTGTFNYVWNSPAHRYFNPIEMSYQAPFVDAARAVDPVNRENTFISYYSYGSILGLALDLSLREKGLHLDDFMKHVWDIHGKTEVAYTVSDLEARLGEYAGEAFAKAFFSNYIYSSNMPDYKTLLSQMGLTLSQDLTKPSLGIAIKETDGGLEITRNTSYGSAAYTSGLDIGDVLTAIDGVPIKTQDDVNKIVEKHAVNDAVIISYISRGVTKTASVILISDPTYSITTDEKAKGKLQKNREAWLHGLDIK